MTSKKIRKPANIIFASLGVLLSYGALAESAPTNYKYGAQLDIVRVLSISTPKTPVCKLVDRTMKYIDSSGKIQALKYRALSDGCNKGR